jgi:hypothetical protein
MRRLAIMAAILLLAACANSPADSSKGRVSFPSGRAGGSTTSGAALLDFKAPKLGGGQVIGSEFVGKDVALWFWAPW